MGGLLIVVGVVLLVLLSGTTSLRVGRLLRCVVGALSCPWCCMSGAEVQEYSIQSETSKTRSDILDN